jgi:hypothetical protein
MREIGPIARSNKNVPVGAGRYFLKGGGNALRERKGVIT